MSETVEQHKANILNQQIDSLKNKNQKLADTNTKLNNENVKFKSQINSQKKSFDDLQEDMRSKPLRTWIKLLLNKK
jgi:cell division protein FtsB